MSNIQESGPPPAASSAAGVRHPGLDVLRCVAVLLVIGHHWFWYGHYGEVDGTSLTLRFFWLTGWAGVDLFFVLSGFLVSGLIFREYLAHGHFLAGRFLVRRGLKLYPAAYVLLVVTVLALTATGSAPGWRPVLVEACYVRNYAAGLFDHTWSLAVEEHFYLLLCLMLYLLGRSGRPVRLRPLACIYVIVALACLAFRWHAWQVHGYFWDAIYSRSHTRMDSLLFGVVLSYLHAFHPTGTNAFVLRHRTALLALGLPLAALPLCVQQDSPFMCTVGLLLMSWGYGILTLVVLTSGVPAAGLGRAVFRAAARTGEYSYSIYLWHLPLLHATRVGLERLLGHRPPQDLWLACYLAGSLGGGALLATLIELPVLRLRDRLFPSRSGALPLGAPPAPGAPGAPR